MGYHCRMQKIGEMDVLGDGALQARIVRLSAWLAAAGLVGGVVAALAGGADGGAALTPWWWVALVVATLAALPAHELVHAAGFKLLCPGCRVGFGLEGAFLYTKTDGAVLSRARMACVLVAPAVAVTAALAAGAAAAGCPALATLLSAAHLSGCAGDLLMAREVLLAPGCTHVRDTSSGIELLAEGGPAPERAARPGEALYSGSHACPSTPDEDTP